MMTPLRCLLVEDSADDAVLILRQLREDGYDVAAERVDTPEAMRAALDRQPWDIIISDYKMPRFSGVAALELLKASGLQVPLILVSGTIGEDVAVETMKLGASDYLLKDRLTRLGTAVAHAVTEFRLRRDKIAAGNAVKQAEARYRGIFEHARDGIIQTTLDGTIVAANPALARIFGYESAEAFMREAPSIVGRYIDPAQRADMLRQLQASGMVVDFEIEMRRKDGQRIWVSNDVQIVRDELGQQRIEGTVVDITERKRAEAVVRESVTRLLRRRRVTVGVELAILGGLTVAVYALAGHFNWFEAVTGWVLAESHMGQLDELVLASVFLAVGLLVFGFRRWRESESDATSQRHVHESLQVLHDALDFRVRQRTAELHETNNALRAEAAERTRAEAALHVQSSALTAAAHGVVITDRNGIVVWVNPAFTTLTGYSFAETVGMNSRDLITSVEPEDAFYESLWQTITAGRVWRGELTNRRKDGSHYDEELTVTPVLDAAGQITHFVGIKQDLTERRATEYVVETSRRKFQAVFEQAAVGMIIAEGPRDRFVNVNRRFCAMVGYTVEELLHLSSHDITHPDDLAVDTDQLAQISSGAIPSFSREKRYRRKDGSYLWAKAFVAPLNPAEAKPTLRIGVIEDITVRKQMEEQLAREQQLFKAVVEKSSEGVTLAERDGRIRYGSPATTRMLGRTADEFLAQSAFRYVHPEDAGSVRKTFAELVQRPQGAAAHTEFRVQHKNGAWLWFEVHGTNLLDDPGVGAVVLNFRDITERKQMEGALRREKTLFGELIRTIPDLIWLKDPNGVFLACNAGFERLFGATQADIVGKTDFDFIDRERAESYQAHDRAVMASGHPDVSEAWLTFRDDGFRGQFETIKTPMVDGEGKLIGVLGIARDITARKRGEEELRNRNALIEAILAKAPIGFAVNTLNDGQVVFVSRNFETIYGLAPGSVRNVAEHFDRVFLDPVFRENIRQRIMADVASGDASRMRWDNISFTTRAGEYRVVNAINIPLPDQNMMISTVQDVTDRWRAETELRASEERYRLLFENNPLAMWLYDLETLRFLAVNESAVQHYGYSREEFLAMTITQIRPAEDIPALLRSVEEGRNETTSSREWRHRRKDGTIIHVEIIARPLVFNGRNARLVLAADITEKKLLEEKFLHAQRLESLGMLAAGVAHDLNNVLAPIVFAAPLLRDSLSAPRDLKILKTLEHGAERGAGLVKQILGFAHSTGGEFRLTQVKHLLRDIVDVIEGTFPKSIQFEHHIPSDLWPVFGNPTQIHQILLNLCVNARDAMPSGGRLVLAASNRRLDEAQAATLPGARPGPWLVLDVTDTGTGITPEVAAHIWEPFFTTKSVGKGTGLGLPTVRGIVTSHHGFIELQTEVGRGTTFRVFLPGVEDEPSRSSSASPFAAPKGHGELILVVDDDQAVRESVAAILARYGYRILSAADGVEAISHFNTHSTEIALVVTDVDMPHIDGPALGRILAQLRPDLQLLMMSGLSAGTPASGAGAETDPTPCAFLQKPFTPETLLNAVDRVLHPPTRP